MKTETWHRTNDKLPPENVSVLTVSSTGCVIQRLKRIGPLWFFPDGSMYVYYTVASWREEDDNNSAVR